MFFKTKFNQFIKRLFLEGAQTSNPKLQTPNSKLQTLLTLTASLNQRNMYLCKLNF